MASRFEKLLQEASFPPFVERTFSKAITPDQMSRTRIQIYQEEAVKEVVSRAYQNSPFYRDKLTQAGVQPKDIKTLEDFAKVPFTTKEDLRIDPWVRLACDRKDVSLIHVSSGTTGGREIYTPHTWKEYYLNHSIIYPRLTPVKREDIAFVALPYEMSQSGLNYHNLFLNGHQATSVPVGKGGAYSTPEKTIKLMANLMPNFIATSPSYAIHLAEAAEAASFDLTTLPLKRMFIAGEGCSNAFRSRLETIWHTTINFHYGATECGFIARECDQHDGLHVTAAHVLVEIVDPESGKVLNPGEIGEIVVTCLLRFDTPLIRYRTRDLGYLNPKMCKCGVALPRLYHLGRAADHIILRGKSYSPYALEEQLMRIPEIGNWYQFIVQQVDNERLTIHTEAARGIAATPDLVDKCTTQLERALGVPCEVHFLDRMDRPMVKAKRVIYTN